MKCKKFLALVMSAVLSVSMLTACGGGGSGVSGSLNESKVNSLLKNEAGSNVQIVKDNDLDDAVKAGAERIVSTGNSNSASAVVANKMGWDFVSVATQLINSIKNSGGITSIGTSFGITYVIEENTLEINDGLGLVGLFAQTQIVVFGLQIYKRKDQLILDHFPEDSGHFISIHLHKRSGHFNFFHKWNLLSHTSLFHLFPKDFFQIKILQVFNSIGNMSIGRFLCCLSVSLADCFQDFPVLAVRGPYPHPILYRCHTDSLEILMKIPQGMNKDPAAGSFV